MSIRSRLVLVVCLVAASALYALFWTPYGIDDPWITYRYAEQLAAGNGFVYNTGERVLGTSTPLYTLLLAAAASITLPVPLTSYAIGYLSMLATLVGVYLLTREIHSDVAGLIAVVFVLLMQQFHRVATYGMETPFFLAMIVFACYAYARGALAVASALAALCLVARLDGAAVGAALFVTYVVQHRRVPWAAAAVYLAIALPWFLFAQLYFGSVLPNSFIAKRQHPGTAVFAGWLIKWMLLRPYAWPAAAGALVALRDPRRFAALPMLVWASMYVVAYTLSSLWRYEWYLTPMTVPLGIFSAIAVVALAGVAKPAARAPVLAGAVVILLVVDVLTLAAQIRKGRYENAFEKYRYEASLWMQANLPRDTTIATGGIGMPGYFTRSRILDTAGLVSPQLVGELGEDDFFMRTAITGYRPPYAFHSRMDLHDYMKDEYVVLKTWDTGDPDVPRYLLACRKPCQ